MSRYFLVIIFLLVNFASHAFDLNKLARKMEFKANLNHREAFLKVGQALVRDQFLTSDRTELSILYPGAGSHIAVLDLGLSIKKENPSLVKIVFIITDISVDAKNTMLSYIKELEVLGEISSLTQSEIKFEQGEEYRINFVDVETDAIFEIIYAVDRADVLHDIDREIENGGRIFYYRQSYFDRADVIIHHDSSMDRSVSTFLSDFLVSLNRSLAKKKVFIFEDMNSYHLLPRDAVWANYSLFPGILKTLPLAFGCRLDDSSCVLEEDHLGGAKYSGLVIYYPDAQFWGELTDFEIKSYLLMAVMNHFPDTGPFNPDGVYFLLIDNIPALKGKIDSALDMIIDKLQNHSLLNDFRLLVEKFRQS